MSTDDADDNPEEMRARIRREADPEFLALAVRCMTLATRLKQQGEVAQLDAGIFTADDSTPADAATLCRGQAALFRESAALHNDLAETYEQLGEYFARKA